MRTVRILSGSQAETNVATGFAEYVETAEAPKAPEPTTPKRPKK